MAQGKEPLMKKINPPEGKKKDVPVRSAHRAQAPKWWNNKAIPNGWEAVPVGKKIKPGDFFWCSGIEWVPTHSAGSKVGTWITYIRRIKTAKRSAKAVGRSRPKSSRNPKATPKSPTPKPSRRAG